MKKRKDKIGTKRKERKMNLRRKEKGRKEKHFKRERYKGKETKARERTEELLDYLCKMPHVTWQITPSSKMASSKDKYLASKLAIGNYNLGATLGIGTFGKVKGKILLYMLINFLA